MDEASNQAAFAQQEQLKNLAEIQGLDKQPMPKRLLEEGQVEQRLKPVEKPSEGSA